MIDARQVGEITRHLPHHAKKAPVWWWPYVVAGFLMLAGSGIGVVWDMRNDVEALHLELVRQNGTYYALRQQVDINTGKLIDLQIQINQLGRDLSRIQSENDILMYKRK